MPSLTEFGPVVLELKILIYVMEIFQWFQDCQWQTINQRTSTGSCELKTMEFSYTHTKPKDHKLGVQTGPTISNNKCYSFDDYRYLIINMYLYICKIVVIPAFWMSMHFNLFKQDWTENLSLDLPVRIFLVYGLKLEMFSCYVE